MKRRNPIKWLGMLLTMLAMLSWSSVQAQDVSYVDANGVEQTLADGTYTVVDSDAGLVSGWYVLTTSKTISDRITIGGDVHLVLCDGATLTAEKGIRLEDENKLHIYGQSAQSGELIATGQEQEAGIGGNIHNTGGTLEVNGGRITATGGKCAAGIGGGSQGYWAGSYGHGGTFIINGGSVTATGGDYGAGIGGGGYYTSASSVYPGNGGVAIFNGGQVTAKGGGTGYGVGPGRTSTRDGEPTNLKLNWTKGDERYFISSANANVTFENIFVTEDSGDEVTADNYTGTTIVPPTGNLYEVTFLVNGEIYAKNKVLEGYTVKKPNNPIVAGKHFVEWQLNGTAYDFSAPVIGDLTLEATFEDYDITVIDGVYQIGTAKDWATFTEVVASTDAKANAVLTDDVVLAADAPMLGVENAKFGGTFDGQNHTLTVAYVATGEGVAPFLYTDGAVVRNLTVGGSITTGYKYAGGFGAYVNATAFENCVSSVTINSSVNGDGTHGGFVALTQTGTNSFTDCVFDGKLLGSSTNSCAGFVGYRSATTDFTRCLFAPAEVTIGTSNSHSFCRNGLSAATDIYYTQMFGGASGSLVATITADEGVTFTGQVTTTHKGVNYYQSPATLTLGYTVPEGKFFDKYTVNSGTLSNPRVIDGEHVLSDFTQAVTITGHYVDSQISIENAVITVLDSLVYNIQAQEPRLKVVIDGKELVKDNDYEVEYDDITSAGEHSATLIGLGCYIGQKTVNFEIAPRQLSDNAISVSMPSKASPSAQPEPTIKYGDYQLVKDTDFELSYDVVNGVNTVIVTGKGNYCDTLNLTYTILGGITYLAYDAEAGTFSEAVCSDYQLLYDQTELTSGYWVVVENVTNPTRINVVGDVHLILMDSVTYTASQGFGVNYNSSTQNSLTIYAQSQGNTMGKLVTTSASGHSGIGGDSKNNHGIITINGGDINASAGSGGSGIGSGGDTYNTASNSYIYIHGGKVTAHGGSWSAGIGGGDYSNGGNIIITGGEVNSQGGRSGGSGIGGSDGYPAYNITITGGTINAIGGSNSAGIGGGGAWSSSGAGGNSGTINILGGNIYAEAGTDCPTAIGASRYPKSATATDVVTFAWTDGSKDYISTKGNVLSGAVNFDKAFALQGTYTRATLSNIVNETTIVPAYGVTVDSVANGTIVVDKEVSPVDSLGTVTLNVTPEEGFRVVWVKVTLDNAETQVPVYGGNGVFTFTMPANDVTVSALFDGNEIIKGDVNGDGDVNAQDVTALINVILGNIVIDPMRSDVNGDGATNAMDVTALIAIILQ